MSYVLDLQGLAGAEVPAFGSSISTVLCVSLWSVFVCFTPEEG